MNVATIHTYAFSVEPTTADNGLGTALSVCYYKDVQVYVTQAIGYPLVTTDTHALINQISYSTDIASYSTY